MRRHSIYFGPCAFFSVFALSGLAAPSALAQDAPAGSAAPCAAAAYRAFDFWLGTWDVTNTTTDKTAGRNIITSAENGCLILERWTSAGGGTGQSYNYYDPHREKWRQVWVSGPAIIDYEGGLNDAGEMVLEGEIVYRNGETAPFRGIWTPNADGSVTQHFDQYDDETDDWQLWFEGRYVKAAEDSE